MTTVSILIKALNEERRIGRCLDSALRSAADYDVEIILVDSLSSDRTLEIARRYPIRIVQFANKEDVGCASAVQLAYQYARGDYLYILDGDMEIIPGFISAAIGVLQRQPDVAGVGGRMIDISLRNSADIRRRDYYSNFQEYCAVPALGGGGLYRRAAIESVGYLADRWLKAGEELDLGLRLKAAGWGLVRIPLDAVIHEGHDESSYALVRRIFRSGRMSAYGLILRRSFGTRYFLFAVRNTWFIFVAPLLYVVIGIAALAIASYGVLNGPMAAAISLVSIMSIVTVLLALRKGSFKDAAIALLAWHQFAIAGVEGFVRPLKTPYVPISSIRINAG